MTHMDHPGYKAPKGQGNYKQRRGSGAQLGYLNALAKELGMERAEDILAECFHCSPDNALKLHGDMGSMMGAITWAKDEVEGRRRAGWRSQLKRES